MNLQIKFIAAIVMVSLVSCGPDKNIYRTPQGGFRLKSPKGYPYYKKNYTPTDTLLIDTNAIYVRQKNGFQIFARGREGRLDTVPFPVIYYRFYSKGRVLKVYPGDKDIDSTVNDTGIGHAGSYVVRNGKLKMDIVNSNQTDFEYGYFLNGDIIIFNETPETFNGSYTLVKYFSKRDTTRWAKVKVKNLKPVNLTW